MNRVKVDPFLKGMTSLEEQSAPQKPSFIFKLVLIIPVVFLLLAGLKFLQVQELLQKVLSWVVDLEV